MFIRYIDETNKRLALIKVEEEDRKYFNFNAKYAVIFEYPEGANEHDLIVHRKNILDRLFINEPMALEYAREVIMLNDLLAALNKAKSVETSLQMLMHDVTSIRESLETQCDELRSKLISSGK